MHTQKARWRVFANTETLQTTARDTIQKLARQSIAERGRFDIVLAGGTTPRAIYQQLTGIDTDWSKWHIWYGDERCLPADDSERNSLMAATALLNHVAIPADQIHPIPAELGAAKAAVAYSDSLRDVGIFDLVLLGMGEDAHTASLFPGQIWEQTPPMPAIAVKNAPKPPADRVSLSASRLSQARQVLFIVTGAGKRQAVQLWRDGVDVPVRAIVPESGIDIFIDAEANQTP